MIIDELDCFDRQAANHLGLLARLDVMVLDVLERFLPIVAITKIARSLLHLVLAPGHFLVGDPDQFFGSVGNHFRLQFAEQRFAPDRITDDVARVSRSCLRCRRSLKTAATALAGTLPSASAASGSLPTTRLTCLTRRCVSSQTQ